MSLETFYVSQTSPSIQITWKYSDNTPIDITGATFAGTMSKGAVTKSLTSPNFTITTAASGICTYAQTATDMNQAGDWIVQVTMTLGSKEITSEFTLPIREKRSA